MRLAEYKKMHEEEQSFFWHIGRRVLIEQLLKRFQSSLGPKPSALSLLDLGCGTGGNFPVLKKFGQVISCDIEPEALRFARRQFPKGKWLKADAVKLPFRNESFDVVTAFDLLEHLQKERAALKEWMRVLKPGGLLVLTVPAYQWLWSDHDRALGHKRRYTKASLEKSLRGARFKVLFLTYYNFLLFFVLALHRFLNRGHRQESYYPSVPRWANDFVGVPLASVDGWLASHTSLPWDSTVVAVAVKQ
jgi:SAM-dependent methyltransferase